MNVAPLSPAVRLAALACTLVSGELTAFALPAFAPFWQGLVCVYAVALLAAYGWRVRHLIFPAVFLLGTLLAFRVEDHRQRILFDNARTDGTRPPLVLSIDSPPKTWVGKDSRPRTSFDSHAGPLFLRVTLPGTNVVPRLGERWSIRGSIARPRKDRGQFAERTLWVPESERPVRVNAAPNGSASGCYTTCASILSRQAGLGLDAWPVLADLNRAILLGSRNGLSRRQRETFAAAGTIHVFAISGLHVMVVSLLLNAFLGRFGITDRARGLVSVPMIAAYTILTGARPSAVRAAFMVSLWLLAPSFGRRPNALAAWSITAFLVYLLNPELLFDLGCTLSFTVMLGIVLWTSWSRLCAPLTDETSRHMVLDRHDWGTACKEAFAGQARVFGVSLAAWIAGVPIAAAAFGRFTPGGLLANLVVIACVRHAVKLGMAGMLCGLLCAPLAALFNIAAAGFTEIMTLVSENVARLPFANYKIEPWSTAMCLGWYLAWIALFLLAGKVLPRRIRVAKRWW